MLSVASGYTWAFFQVLKYTKLGTAVDKFQIIFRLCHTFKDNERIIVGNGERQQKGVYIIIRIVHKLESMVQRFLN